MKHHQAHRFNLDADRRDLFEIATEPYQRLAEGFTADASFDHQLECDFRGPDRPHAVVDTPGTKTQLGDFEAAALTQQDVVFGNSNVVQSDMHVAMWSVIFAEDLHTAHDLDTRVIHRDQDLGMLFVCVGIGVRHHHGDHDLAAWVTGTGDVELLAVDDPLVAIEHRTGGDVACV